ncbi:uncharacterized protein LOC112505121 [Cynara cardunculus var. scolymus]|uniref:Uncharacterized protein n=1 Tax=Cynara cardunculus var. scolymus TaxID=59895 RepID=A0A103YN56_CYNCS|nr:uncharacterized protein LOC112505121 [Cynara cardunculus var. scolymus]KVI12199.1 hypothetical protein Ccrd_009339 [Cynara cardunculus var. scolymus]
MALIETQNPVFIGDEYELAINQSIQSVLDSLQNPNHDLSVFTSTFLKLMQAKPDPLLETIWVFSGLVFQIDNPPKDDILDEVLAVKDLFQSITAYSASCSPSVSIALIAPVIFKLYGLAVDSKRKDADLKRGKKAKREIRSLLDVILGYFNVCCEGPNGDEDSGLVRPLNDLVSIWVHGEGNGNGAGKNGLKQFFPLFSDEIIDCVTEESAGVLGLLAGAVILEAFLLKLCLKFSDGSSRQELQNDLRNWAVCSITGFHNFYFFDMLVKMLLEPNLTVMSLLSSEDESFLRKLIYDVVILPDYSFLNLEKVGHLSNNHVKNNILSRLMVTHEAIELSRKNKDHTKAISYTNAFSGSHLPTVVTKLVTSELGAQGIESQRKGSSPAAFLKWMLDLEDQGLRLCDGFMSKHRERLVRHSSRLDLDQPSSEKTDNNLLFFIDNKGNDEDENINDSMNDVFVAAAHEMQSGKKRKEIKTKDKDGVKFQRHNLSGPRAAGEFKTDDSDSASEVDDPYSDEDLE